MVDKLVVDPYEFSQVIKEMAYHTRVTENCYKLTGKGLVLETQKHGAAPLTHENYLKTLARIKEREQRG